MKSVSVMAVHTIAVSSVPPISPITGSRSVKTEERPMDQEDVFCPRFPDLDSQAEIAQWYDPYSCQKCCGDAKRGKCAREKRKNCG